MIWSGPALFSNFPKFFGNINKETGPEEALAERLMLLIGPEEGISKYFF